MKKILILIIIAVLLVAIPLVKSLKQTTVKQIEVTTATERVIHTSVLASGRLAHEDQVRLTTEVIGKVKEVRVIEGDYVKKGQLLLVLDDETYAATVRQREAVVRMQKIAIEKQLVQLDNLERQWERKRKLHQQKLIDDDAYEAFTSQLELARIDVKSAKESLLQAEAQLNQAQDQLQKTRVLAPINGRVTSLDIKEGETAIASSTNIAGSSLMTIANPESTITEVFVDEADVANIRVGQSASIVAIAYPDDPIKGEVKSIATSAKTVAGRQGLSFLVKLSILDDAGIALKPGMSCRAEIYTNSSDPVTAVPLQAVIVNEKRSENLVKRYVFTYDNGVAKKHEIKTGASDDNYIEVIEGIPELAEIIKGPDRTLRHLNDGDEVVIKEP
ncbi:efflux RND transporter periplasmic adaptor subunit [Pleionea litopenaei]|uniref:Efflux RND transporter periplasmic adaptor subunit n=1 Tax=Pleionea litopenaei TaxID=3070815 RepID=A0AA51X841_9GAMM|nr:efflux RND transporter periplasmic adaptor subunit [Pleionea sp. HL-JVS1]WMS88554.1 efflux RND transporter periplasmic adaptor subunit [Pleionea sp. HL-JVS1]